MNKLLEQINNAERKTKKLGDVVGYIADNRGKNPTYYTQSGIPVIDNFMITGNRKVDLSLSKRFIDENIYKNFIRKEIKENDVLVTLVGNGYGQIALAPKVKSVIIQNTVGLRSNDLSLNLYLFYLLTKYKDVITGLDRGAAQPSVKVGDLLDIEFDLPDIPTQKKIASILGAYDEKIENNNKIIKNLEETAQTIFNEWFVNFKFPGYENVKMVDSEMGEIPEGWKKFKLGDVFDIKYGKNLPTSKINEKGKFPVYGAGGVIGFYKEKNVDEKVVLVTCRGNGSGKIWRTNGEGFVTNNSFVILPKKDFNYINFTSTYFLFKNSNVESALSGSAQPQITIDGLNPIDLLLPSKYVLENFQRITKKVFDLIDKTEKENISLKSQRDLLLNKLI